MKYTDPARIKTEKILERIEAEIVDVYGQAIIEMDKAASKWWRDFDKQDRRWWKRMQADPDNKALEEEWRRWRRDQLLTGDRFTPIREEIEAQILNAHTSAIDFVNRKLPQIYTANYNYLGSSIYEGLTGYSFTLMDVSAVRALALTNTRLLPYREVDGKEVLSWSGRAIRSEITQGIIQGDSIPNIAKRLERVAEMDAKTAVRTARTMVTSAESKGKLDALEQAANSGIIVVKKWHTMLDGRQRHAHEELDGDEKPFDEPFVNSIGPIMRPGDPDADGANVYNCRCALGARVVGFRRPE